MHTRNLALLVAVGVGLSIAAFTVAQWTTDSSSTEGLSPLTVTSLTEQLTRGELEPERLVQVVESLVQILDEEIRERRVLEEQLQELRAEVADLQQNLRARVESAFSIEETTPTPPRQAVQAGQSMDARLMAAGFTRQQVESLRRREESAQMRQIELDDRARREGWLNTPQYFDEFNQLSDGTDAVRRDLGDDAYDRYLFASRRPNRITVSNVIATSPAEQAGLRPGDVIKSYAGERVFSAEQLVDLRSAGDKGAPVTLELIRNGESVQITMPRGPMGVQSQPTVVDPSTQSGS